jgi:hypothetical protein
MNKATFLIIGGVMVGDRHTDGNKQQNRKRCFVCRNVGCKGLG